MNGRRIFFGTLWLIVMVASFFAGRFSRPPVAVISYEGGLAVTDLSDDRRLVGSSKNVFFGEVIELSGRTEEMRDLPETQFAVRVLENLKGELRGQVTVNQLGGFDASQNAVVLFENDPIIQVGGTYLLVTRPREFTDGSTWHTLVPKFGDLVFRGELQKSQLRERFVEAFENEIPLDRVRMPGTNED